VLWLILPAWLLGGMFRFDFCAVCVKDFLKSHMGIEEGSDRKDLVLGFTVISRIS
jgi:hypothetical protein